MTHVSTDAQMQRYLEIMDGVFHYYLSQAPAWPKVKQNWLPDYFVSEKEGASLAALMLTVINNNDGTGLAYLARGPVGADTPDLVNTRAIINDAIKVAREHHATTFRWTPEWDFTPQNQALLETLAKELGGEALIFPQHTAQPVIDVIGKVEGLDFDAWFAGLSSQSRTNARAALKRGATAQVTTDCAMIDELYRLIEVTAQRQGITYRPKSYFKQLVASFPHNHFFCTTTYEGRIISASLNVVCKDTVYFLYAGNEVIKGLNGAHLMHIEIYAEAIRRGLSFVNMGGVFALDKSDGLYAYKRRLAGDDSARCFVGEINVDLSRS